MRHHTPPLITLGLLVVLLLAIAPEQPPARAQQPRPTPEPRIVGGGPAQPGAWPAAAALVDAGQADAHLGQFCGGNLVAPDWVLTAAHCITLSNGAIITAAIDVVLGRSTLSDTGGERIRVVEMVRHPNFNLNDFRNDVALLRLSRPSVQTPMALITAEDSGLIAPGSPAIIIGWGTTRARCAECSDQLKQAQVSIVSDADCNAQYGPDGVAIDGPTMLCAAAQDTDTCEGDSGGPLMVQRPAGQWVEAALTSFGTGCARPDRPGVYAEVLAARIFITDTIGPTPSPAPSPSPSSSPTPSPTPTSSPSPTPTPTPTPTPSPTPSPAPSPSPTATPAAPAPAPTTSPLFSSPSDQGPSSTPSSGGSGPNLTFPSGQPGPSPASNGSPGLVVGPSSPSGGGAAATPAPGPSFGIAPGAGSDMSGADGGTPLFTPQSGSGSVASTPPDGCTGPGCIISPSPGSTLPAGRITFRWTTAPGVREFIIQAIRDEANGVFFFERTTATEATWDLQTPRDGRPLTVRLSWQLADGTWRERDYTYIAPTGGSGQSPSPTPPPLFPSQSPSPLLR